MTDSPLTAASEKLLSDFDRHPDAIDHSELSARLWLIEREAATRAKASGEGLRAGDCAYQCPHTEDAHRLDLDHEFVPAPEAAAGEARGRSLVCSIGRHFECDGNAPNGPAGVGNPCSCACHATPAPTTGETP